MDSHLRPNHGVCRIRNTDLAGPPGVDEPFSVYGILNPKLDTQTVLVSATEAALKPTATNIDAQVTSTNLQTGVTRQWRDSVVTGPTGHVDHIFWADFRPDYGSRHRIEVRRSDGEVSSVETTIPKLITIEGKDRRSRDFDIMLYGDDFRPLRVNVYFHVQAYFAHPDYKDLNDKMPFSNFVVSLDGQQEKVDGGWSVPVDLDSEYGSLQSQYFIENEGREPFESFWNQVCDGLGLHDMRVQVTVGSDEWELPGGSFNPFIQSFPRVLSNVENGFGFVTGGYDVDAPLYPSTTTLADTPFFDYILTRNPNVEGCGNYVGS